MDRSRKIIPKQKNLFNKYIAMFLIPIFEKNIFRYSYGNSANPSDIENLIIKLPVDHFGNPD